MQFSLHVSVKRINKTKNILQTDVRRQKANGSDLPGLGPGVPYLQDKSKGGAARPVCYFAV